MTALVLGIPSKGRLMEATEALLGKAGFALARNGSDRLYRGHLGGIDGVDVAFLSASEIASSSSTRRTGIVPPPRTATPNGVRTNSPGKAAMPASSTAWDMSPDCLDRASRSEMIEGLSVTM